MEGPQFLKNKYNAHSSPEVQSASKRTYERTGEKVPQKPTEQIQNYLDRFKEIIEREDPEKKERGLNALKKILHEEHIIGSEDIPESYFKLQQQIAREQGHGDVEITDELRTESVKVVQADQRESMDMWIDYLSSNDALYPDWVKYWVFRSMLGMSSYDKEKHEFGSRTKETTAPFPDLNREALAYVVDTIEKRNSPELDAVDIQIRRVKNSLKDAKKQEWENKNSENDSFIKKREELDESVPLLIAELEQKKADLLSNNPVQEGVNEFAEEEKLVSDDEFQKLMGSENFAKYYAFAIEHVVADNSELYKITDGEWRAFEQGSEAQALTSTIQGHGTGWCTAGESTAASQLELGNFYVYYSKNKLGETKIPRLAIRMEDEQIAEVRGVAHQQEIDPYISPVLQEKMDEFGEQGEVYKKKATDMRLLTEIDHKHNAEEPLRADELRFLYEMDSKIEGFGYETDPRIEEIRESGDWKTDMAVVFSAGSDTNLANSMIEAGLREKVLNNFTQFTELSVEIADKLIEAGEAKCVVSRINQFEHNAHVGIAHKLVEAQQGIYVAAYLKEFKGLDHDDIANKLIDTNQATFLGEHLRDFKGLDHDYIANACIDSGQGKSLLGTIENFSLTDTSSVVLRLIDEGYMYDLMGNLNKFTTLNSEIAYKILEDGRIGYVLQNLDSFKGISHSEIAEWLVSVNKTSWLASNIMYLKGLKTSMAPMIIDAISGDYEANDFARWFAKVFKDPDHNQIATKLIEVGYGKSVTTNILRFKNLNESTAHKLVDAGLGLYVVRNLDIFSELDEMFVTDLKRK